MRPMIAFAVLAALPTLAFTNLAFAQAAPKGTAPVPAAEIKQMFAGKTYNFTEKGHKGEKEPISWYLAADGRMLGYTGNGPSHAEGTWSTADGKLCVSDQWTGAWGTNHSNECQLWARDAAKPTVLYRAEPSKGGKWAKFTPKLSGGDTITPKIEALKVKLQKG
ncbi:DUF995 domain-containing protein [Rhizobium sp. S152]|uniref:DUF995 domain-containing protein n=1 Tax=Rhizobium sp. S152 TaxID=3055038 RepID=UPI0025A985E5|nr:DUF995 domain-containing protein [Rhizobium sp. S152]MDM9626666.1 DUF995 domain-containing protein [Rhizobium sp. S152]